MSAAFDPYHRWLGISPAEQPPNHYRLLGVGLFEADADVIEDAADRQMAHIQRHQLGQHAALSQKLLNDLTAAKLCLLSPQRKDAYDRALAEQLAAKAAPAAQVATPLTPENQAATKDKDANFAGPTPTSDLPQQGRAVGNRPTAGAQNSTTGIVGPKQPRSKKPAGSNLLILGGSMAAGVVVLAIVAIVANRDKPAPPIASKPAEHSDWQSILAEESSSEAKPATVPRPSDAEEPSVAAAEPASAEPTLKSTTAPTEIISQAASDAPPAHTEERPKDPLAPAPAVMPTVKTRSTAASFTLDGPQSPIRSIAVTKDSQRVMAATSRLKGEPRTLYFWNLEERREDGEFAVDRDLVSAQFSSDEKKVYFAAPSGDVLQHYFGLEAKHYYDIFNRVGNPETYCMDVLSDGSGIVTGGTDGLYFSNYLQNNPSVLLWKHPAGAPVTAVAGSPDTVRLWAGCGGKWNGKQLEGGRDHKLHLWDGSARRPMEVEGHRGGIWGLSVSNDGSRVVTASEDHTLRIWDARTLKSLRVLPGHEGPVYCATFSANGKFVLSGGLDGTVRLWNVSKGEELKRFEGHTEAVLAVALTPDGKHALSGGNDTVLRVWDLKLPMRRPPRVADKPKSEDSRIAVPNKKELEEATKLVVEIYADDFKQAKRPAEKIALAEKILEQSAASQSEAERYALLSEARALATAGGNPVLAIQIIEQIGSRYDVDVAREIAEFSELLPNTLPAAKRREITAALLTLAEGATARGEYDTARRLFAAASQSARKANDPALVKQVAARMAEIAEVKKALEAYQKAIDKLESSPDDAESHLAAGLYLSCFKQDWESGLGHLAKGSDPTLKEIAELEITEPTSPEDQIKLADLWWARVEESKGKEKSDFAQRCDKWYALALPSLKGLSQAKVAKRIEELAQLAKTADAPSAPGGSTTTSKSIGARFKTALKKGTLVRSQVAGSVRGNEFSEVPPTGAILAGFKFYFTTADYLGAVQGQYWGPRGMVPGAMLGGFSIISEKFTEVVAKKGYGVAGIRFAAPTGVYGIQVIFAKLTDKGLDLSDRYTSDWIGNSNYAQSTAGDNREQPAVGFFGNGNDISIFGIGLIQLPAE